MSTFNAGIPITTNHVADKGEGSLGCYALAMAPKKRPDGLAHDTPVLLTCSHVLFPGFRVAPDPGVFADRFSTCCSTRIGTTAFDRSQVTSGTFRGGFGAPVGTTGGFATDCAIAKLNLDHTYRNVFNAGSAGEIPIVGSPASGLGVVMGPAFGTAPSASQYVRACLGGQKRLQFGTIAKIAVAGAPTVSDPNDPQGLLVRTPNSTPSDAAMGVLPLINFLVFLPRPDPAPGQQSDPAIYAKTYADPGPLDVEGGDSGSVVINSAGQAVGLISRAASPATLGLPTGPSAPMELAQVRALAFVVPIKPVLDLLGIVIPSFPKGWTNGKTARGEVISIGVSSEPPTRRAAARLAEGLRRSRRGKLLLGKIAEHRDEIRALFSKVRALQVAWHRLGGARLFAHAIENAIDPRHPLPTSIDGVSREELAQALIPLVERHASPKLRRDIARHRAWATAALLPIASIDEVPRAVARRWEAA